ncbi:MAG: hypothetical protein ACI8Y7_000004 [Candidatus Woesearchaeota archaeon]|jgi:hypothetical protein
MIVKPYQQTEQRKIELLDLLPYARTLHVIDRAGKELFPIYPYRCCVHVAKVIKSELGLVPVTGKYNGHGHVATWDDTLELYVDLTVKQFGSHHARVYGTSNHLFVPNREETRLFQRFRSVAPDKEHEIFKNLVRETLQEKTY